MVNEPTVNTERFTNQWPLRHITASLTALWRQKNPNRTEQNLERQWQRGLTTQIPCYDGSSPKAWKLHISTDLERTKFRSKKQPSNKGFTNKSRTHQNPSTRRWKNSKTAVKRILINHTLWSFKQTNTELHIVVRQHQICWKETRQPARVRVTKHHPRSRRRRNGGTALKGFTPPTPKLHLVIRVWMKREKEEF